MGFPRNEPPYQAAQDSNQFPTQTFITGTAGTADTTGTAEIVRGAADPVTGAQYVYNLGPAGNVNVSGTDPTVYMPARLTDGTDFYEAGGGAGGGSMVNVVTGTQQTLGTVGTVPGIGVVTSISGGKIAVTVGTVVGPTASGGTPTTAPVLISGTDVTGTVYAPKIDANGIVTVTGAVTLGTLAGLGTVTNLGSVTNVGTIKEVTLVPTVTSVGTLPGAGTLTNLGSVTNIGSLVGIAGLNTGTITSVGTVVGAGTLTNVGSLTNAGTVKEVTTVPTVTTVSTVSAIAAGTQNTLGTVGSVLGLGGTTNVIGTVYGASTQVTGSATAGTTDIIASTDVSNYKILSLQMLNTWVGTVNIQASNDNSTFYNVSLMDQTQTTGGLATNITANGLYQTPIDYKYLRIRMMAFTSGTGQGIAELYAGGQTDNVMTGIVNVNNGTLQINPVPVPTPLIQGTLGTAGGSFFGTLSAASGAGTKHYVSGLQVVVQSGTPDVRILAGTSIQGTGVLAAGAFVPSAGVVREFNPAFATGTNSELTYHFVGAGTAFITVNYWKGT